MTTLLATMGRSRSKVWPESASLAKASQQMQNITTEADRYKALGLIRQLSSPVAVKRQLKEKLMAIPVTDSHGMQHMKYENEKRMKSVSNGWQNFKYSMEPWGKMLKKVEGQHGTGVVSYFVFLRYLLLVNLCMFLLTAFVWVPAAVLDTTPFSASSREESCSSLYAVNVSTNALNLILDFLQGTGWMEKTAVFYGYYNGHGHETTYKLSLAYILVCISCLLISLILMGRHMAGSFRESILSASDGETEFCNMVFCTWDFSLSDSLSASIKHKSIRFELLSDMNELKFLKDRERRLQSRARRCSLYTIRFFINIFIVLCLGGAGYLIYYVTDWSTQYVSVHSDPSTTEAKLLKLLVQYLPSITIVVLNAALPEVFQKIVNGEEYTQAFVIKITLIRTVFLRLASLTVLMATLYSQVTCSTKDTCTTTQGPSCSVITCWETFVGQNLYKLIVMDLLVAIVKTFLVELPRRLLYEKCGCGVMKKIGPPNFELPPNVLDLVYSQCLYWLSLTFAPLTPGMAVVKSFVTFYLKLLSALKACRPPEQPYRTSRSNAFFMIILLIAFFLCCVPVGYTLYNLEPSHGCGPFRSYDKMYQSISTTVSGWPSAAQTVYELLTSPAVTGPLILLLFLVIYYKSVLVNAHKSMSEMFKEQLVLEGRDKHYLTVRLRELGGDKAPLTGQHRKTPKVLTDLRDVDEVATRQPNPRKVGPAHVISGGEKPPPYSQPLDSPGLKARRTAPLDQADNGQREEARGQPASSPNRHTATTGVSSSHVPEDIGLNDDW